MIELCLLVLPWMADPVVTGQSQPNFELSFATCVRPAARVFEANSVCASAGARADDLCSIKHLLNRWESVSSNLPERNRSEREEFRRRVHEDFNEHTLIAAEQFLDHINANRLIETFDWRIVECNRQRICLDAIPRDELERLFYGVFRIKLDATRGNSEQLTVIGRDRVQRILWHADRPSKQDTIELVHFKNDVPPAPGILVRTADTRVK